MMGSQYGPRGQHSHQGHLIFIMKNVQIGLNLYYDKFPTDKENVLREVVPFPSS